MSEGAKAELEAQLDRQVPRPARPKLPKLPPNATSRDVDALERAILDQAARDYEYAAARAQHRRVLDGQR